MGASSSSRLGWLTKISFDAPQSCRISASVSCAFLTVRPPLTSKSRRMMSSSTAASIGINCKRRKKGIENRYELDLASVQGQSNPIGVSYGQRSNELRRHERGFGEGGVGGRKRDIFPRLPICSSIDRRERRGATRL